MDFLRQEDFEKVESSKGYSAQGLRKYLISIFKDLTSRKKSKEKKEVNLSKHIFREYVSLPSIISESLFRVMDKREQGKLSTQDFVEGMVLILTGELNKLLTVIFKVFDLNSDGKVHIDDIKILLVHLERDKNISHDLAHSPLLKAKDYLIRDFEKLLVSKGREMKDLKATVTGINEEEFRGIFKGSRLINKILKNIHEGIPITPDSANVFNLDKMKTVESQDTSLSNDGESSMFLFNLSPTKTIKSIKTMKTTKTFKDDASTTILNLNCINPEDLLHEVDEDLVNDINDVSDKEGKSYLNDINANFLKYNENEDNEVLKNNDLSNNGGNLKNYETIKNNGGNNSREIKNFKKLNKENNKSEYDEDEGEGNYDEVETEGENILTGDEDEALLTIRIPSLKTSRKMTHLINSTMPTARGSKTNAEDSKNMLPFPNQTQASNESNKNAETNLKEEGCDKYFKVVEEKNHSRKNIPQLQHTKTTEKTNFEKISQLLNPHDFLQQFSEGKKELGVTENSLLFKNPENNLNYSITVKPMIGNKDSSVKNLPNFSLQRTATNNFGVNVNVSSTGNSIFSTAMTTANNSTTTAIDRSANNNTSTNTIFRQGTIFNHMQKKMEKGGADIIHDPRDQRDPSERKERRANSKINKKDPNSDFSKKSEMNLFEPNRGSRTPTLFSRVSSFSIRKASVESPNMTQIKNKYHNFSPFTTKTPSIKINSVHEGYVYKQTSTGDKMKKFWIIFINKDIFYFNGEKNKLKGLHNVSSCFSEYGSKTIISGKKYYSFTFIFPCTKRTYFCDTREEAAMWVKSLRTVNNYRDVNEHFEFIKEIGKGQFGAVFLGVDKKSNENVAIKIMDKTKLTLKELDSLRVESEILKKCNHKNIVKFIDEFENTEKIYIILEYLSGKNLFNFLISQEEILSNRINRVIVQQIAHGLKYLSKLGIVHRDLKPENIMISDNLEVKIVDFGLARIFGKDNFVTEVIGTLAYVAPEVIEGHGYGRDIDMWSFGVILYYLLTGKLAFEDPEKLYGVIENQGVKKELFNKKLFPNVSSFAIDLTKKCLSLRKDRITIDEFLKHPWFNTT